jgi:peroxiredoxin
MRDRTETLAVGSVAPEFALSAANREGLFSLRELLGGVLVVEFLRGTWWPNCVKRMAQFELVKDELKKLGASLVYIAAEKRGGFFDPEKFLKKNPISFPFLLDEDRSVTKAYGLHHRLGKDAINIAHPATLVVDRAGVLQYVYRGDNQNDRPATDEVLKAIQKISGS